MRSQNFIVRVTIMISLIVTFQAAQSFTYDQKIKIDNQLNGTNLFNYEVRLVLNTENLISAGVLKSDGSDIRFSADDGVTQLNYWIEYGLNSSETSIWVKIPEIPANRCVYIDFTCGDPTWSAMSNGDSVFRFFDDFELGTIDYTKWIQGIYWWPPNDWKGIAEVSNDPTNNTNHALNCSISMPESHDGGMATLSEYPRPRIIEVQGLSRNAGITGWDFGGLNGYFSHVYQHYLGTGWILCKMYDTPVANNSLIVSDHWYNIKLVEGEDMISAYIDGQLVATEESYKVRTDVLIDWYGIYFRTSEGIFHNVSGMHWFDNIRVRSYSSPEPIITMEENKLFVGVDIKPGSSDNPVNMKENGVLPCAILSTSKSNGDPLNFDATKVLPLSVKMGRGQAIECHNKGHLEDVDGDGDLDMMLHFKVAQLDIKPDDKALSLVGNTIDGKCFTGKDIITIVGKKIGKSAEIIESGEAPIVYGLLQNYPNPFNSSTRIVYCLQNDDHVKIEIIDLSGRKIATLIDQYQSAGYYKINWEINEKKRISSSIYLCKLTTSSIQKTIRIMYIK